MVTITPYSDLALAFASSQSKTRILCDSIRVHIALVNPSHSTHLHGVEMNLWKLCVMDVFNVMFRHVNGRGLIGFMTV